MALALTSLVMTAADKVRLLRFQGFLHDQLCRSLKYEDIYLKDYATVPQLYEGLTDYFHFYNQERPHQALDYRVPQEVYQAGRIHLN